MTEYIERKEIRMAYEKLTRSYVNSNPYIADWRFDEMIEELPAADVAPVRYGRWIDSLARITPYCSACGHSHRCLIRTPNYCPNCGAKMDGKLNE